MSMSINADEANRRKSARGRTNAKAAAMPVDQELSGKSPVALMKHLTSLGDNAKKKLTWFILTHATLKYRVGKIESAKISGTSYQFVAGPSLDCCYLTGMVQETPKSTISLLDISLDSIDNLSIDRAQSMLTIHVHNDASTAWLDFRRISGDVHLQLEGEAALNEALQLLPKSLTETEESQLLSQTRYLQQFVAKQPVAFQSCGRRGEEDDGRDVKNEIEGFDSQISGSSHQSEDSTKQNESSELTSPPSQATPLSQDPIASKSTSDTRRTNTKVYRSRNGRFLGKKVSKPRAAKAREITSHENDSTISEGYETSRAKNSYGNPGIQTDQGDSFDSPPPISAQRPRRRLQKPSEPEVPPRKRGKLESDDDYQPTQKRLRAVRTAENRPTKVASVPQKIAARPLRQTTRRRSAPQKTMAYASQEDSENIEDTENEARTNKPAGTKIVLKLALNNPIPALLLKSARAGESNETPTMPILKNRSCHEVASTPEANKPGEISEDEGNGPAPTENPFYSPELGDSLNVSARPRPSRHPFGQISATRSWVGLSHPKPRGKGIPNVILRSEELTTATASDAAHRPPTSISVPGHGTPHFSVLQPQKRRKDALDVLLESEPSEAKARGAGRKESQLLRMNLDYERDDNSNSSPIPSPSISKAVQSLASKERIRNLLDRDGKSRPAATVSSSDTNNPANQRKKQARIIDIAARTSTLHSAANQVESAEVGGQRVCSQTDEVRPAAQPTDALELFHTKLAAKGLDFCSTVGNAIEDLSLSHYCSSQSDLSESSSDEEMEVEQTKPQPVLPTHQQSVRDALVEITEVDCFMDVNHRLCFTSYYVPSLKRWSSSIRCELIMNRYSTL